LVAINLAAGKILFADWPDLCHWVTNMAEMINQYRKSLNQFEHIKRDDALDQLRVLIAEGDYTPGDRLPPERVLMTRFGVTRNVLRKALDTLEREGAIWRHVGKGTFVASHGSGNTLADLTRLVSPVQLTRARLSLEPAIAREAALHATAEAVAAVKAARDHACNAKSWDDYEAQDDIFHRAIAEATGNVLLLSLFDHLNEVKRAVAWNAVVRASDRPARDHASFADHDEICAAIEARDQAAAQAAMRNHLSAVARRLFGED